MSFTVAAEDVSILHSPAEFYDTLLSAIQQAQQQVSLSSLYIGNGHMEHRLMDTLRAKVQCGWVHGFASGAVSLLAVLCRAQWRTNSVGAHTNPHTHARTHVHVHNARCKQTTTCG